MTGGGEVALFGACRDVWPVDSNHHPTPGAVMPRIVRRVADDVLARQLVRDLAVDVGQIRNLIREEGPAARFLRELPQHEFGFLEAPRTSGRSLTRPESDRVNRGLGAFREIQDFLERQQAGGVLPVRQQYDCLTTDLVAVLRYDLMR